MSVRKSYTPAFKAKVALAAITGDKTLAQLSSEFEVHQTLINKWKKQLLEGASDIFSGNVSSPDKERDKEIHELHAKIGQLTVERDFLARAYGMK